MLGSFAGGCAGVTADAEGQQPANAIASRTASTAPAGPLLVVNKGRTGRVGGGRCGYTIIETVLRARSQPWTAQPASFPPFPRTSREQLICQRSLTSLRQISLKISIA